MTSIVRVLKLQAEKANAAEDFDALCKAIKGASALDERDYWAALCRENSIALPWQLGLGGSEPCPVGLVVEESESDDGLEDEQMVALFQGLFD